MSDNGIRLTRKPSAQQQRRQAWIKARARRARWYRFCDAMKARALRLVPGARKRKQRSAYFMNGQSVIAYGIQCTDQGGRKR